MARSWLVAVGVAVVSLCAVSTADAFNGRLFGLWGSSQPAPARSYNAYYYVVPSFYYYYCPPASGPTVVPVPDARPKMPYAPVVPAPPSPTGEPPLQNMMDKKGASADPRMPVIVTSHAHGGGVSKDRCRVGFWNLSGRDIKLNIDGKTVELAKDRAVTLDLDRQFTWQVEGRPQHVERLADGQPTHEVVIQE